ncbi:MAG: Glutamyl-tRNA(Gln) amidotransferase subunit A [Candidatus Woesebacteria bacterium GW2011_GWA2_40_7b]|uniref:Glutamyl-tRNA(Gln) amidotransferase subunit A n=1 Tax=Candidatus Woesebacteria bacterium GW2011_GWA2_40_7b TaxID=1618563 RepID=A0A0G0VE63_9BACT|nr:MAG: Glutamyl-tRNA(Gln) amidotransferase subunit A [Candidatus Woesebacteria bacterium GW2011_GWA2_40_7b]
MISKLPVTIKETKEGLMKKKFSAVNLVDEYLARIEKNKGLNAFISVSSEDAYKKAKLIDSSLQDLPLLGVTVAHKDLFLTKGVRTTAGSKILESYVPVYSATVVARMEKAGAIMIGKTNCDAWAHGASGENSDFGPTLNPNNKDYVPGGSSSGSAASVSAGLTLIATGTDTGGSVRQPASFCGVVGLKPTYGAVSRYGIIAMASSLDCPGVFGNCVTDVETVFNVIKGQDGYDATVTNHQLPITNHKLRIGIPKEYFAEGLDREVEKSVIEASQILKKKGVELVDVSLPNTKHAVEVYYIIQPAEVSSNLGRYEGIRYGEDRALFGDEAKRRIMLGTYVLSAGYYDTYYLKAQKVRSLIIQDFNEAFSKVDAIIAPVYPTAAFKLGEKSADPLKMYLADILTAPANLAGIPGLAVPNGKNKQGLPLGFQLIGPRFSEPVLFELGKLYERF